MKVLYENVPATQISQLSNVLPQLTCWKRPAGRIYVKIRECLSKTVILVSVFGNPGLFRPHPLGENIQDDRCKAKESPDSRITATSVPILFLPVAGSWVTHRQGQPNIHGINGIM